MECVRNIGEMRKTEVRGEKPNPVPLSAINFRVDFPGI